MKKKLKISASFTGVLPTASYENVRPGFAAEEEFEFDGDNALVDDVIKTRQSELQAICYQSFEAEAEKARIIKIQRDLKNFRFYENENGEKLPSVTSILSYDKDFYCSDDDLKQLAAQGTLIDAEFKNYVLTGVYTSSDKLPNCAAERFIIKRGKKQLALEGWNIQGFLEKYPLKNISVGVPVFNSDWKYGGTPDILCEYEGIKTIADIKRTASETDNFMQMAAYCKCKGLESIKQMMIIPIKPEADGGNKQGFSKAVLSENIDKYFELFIFKRKEFTKLYGI